MCANSGDNESKLVADIADINAMLKIRESEYQGVQAKIKKLEAELVEQGLLDAVAIASHPAIKEQIDKEKQLNTIIIQLYNEKKTLNEELNRLRAGSSQPALVAQPVRARTPTMVHSFGHHGHACTICS
jgi:tyrosine-protein phosphatase YwqE